MKKTLIFQNGKKRAVKSEEGRFYVLSDGTRIRKSNPVIAEVKEAEEKKSYPQNFLDEMPEEDKELFGNVPAESKPICFVPITEKADITDLGEDKKDKKAAKKAAKKGE